MLMKSEENQNSDSIKILTIWKYFNKYFSNLWRCFAKDQSWNQFSIERHLCDFSEFSVSKYFFQFINLPSRDCCPTWEWIRRILISAQIMSQAMSQRLRKSSNQARSSPFALMENWGLLVTFRFIWEFISFSTSSYINTITCLEVDSDGADEASDESDGGTNEKPKKILTCRKILDSSPEAEKKRKEAFEKWLKSKE